MKSAVSWQVEGIGPQARESAFASAQRAGMPVGEWLDRIILNSASGEPKGSAEPPPAPDPTAAREPMLLQNALDHDLAAFNERLDGLASQVSRLTSRKHAGDERDEGSPRRFTDAIWRLDRRVDQLTAEGRIARLELERRVDATDRAIADLGRGQPRAVLAAEASARLDQALDEIAERQRALDALDTSPAAPEAAAPAGPLPRAHTQDLSGLEQQLRLINDRIESLRQPCGLHQAVDVLRDDLAEIGLMVREAMPRAAIEALEAEVRRLCERIDQARHSEFDGPLAGVEKGLGEVRDALRTLTPAESLVGVDQAVRELSQRIELVASNAQDPTAIRQLEAAIIAMRGIVSHVASNDALSGLSQEVHALAARLDQAVVGGNAAILATLEERIAKLVDAIAVRKNGPDAPETIETSIGRLIERIEQIGLTRGDKPLGALEERIDDLVRKLDSSDARLGQLPAIEHGLTELIAQLERQQAASPGPAESSASPAVGSLSREVASLRQAEQETQDVLEMFHGTLGHVVDRLATIESDIRGRMVPRVDSSDPATRPPAAPAATPVPAAAPRPPAPAAAERPPIAPDLPPDHPLEPGFGRNRNPGSPAERVAASEAALAGLRPPVTQEPEVKSDFIAAARRAAQAASRETPARTPAAAPSEIAAAAGKLVKRVGKLRAFIGGASVILLVLITTQVSRSLLGTGDEAATGLPGAARTTAVAETRPAVSADATSAPASAPPAAASATPSPAEPRPDVLPAIDGSAIATPAPGVVVPVEPRRQAMPAPKPAPAAAPSATRAAPPAPALASAAAERLPAAFGGALRTAAAAGDPAAQYEIALRYAEGRGVTQDPGEAASWLERAAAQGLAPAQFRLGGMFEKGLGVRKNLEQARRLYDSAGEAGHGKALHNLAVLHAEGIDGKPDYRAAAHWFRRAADYGMADSQYNLAVLYARGIGVERSMADAYKWFALAAREGDTEAARKRDEVGALLDPRSLQAARDAAQSWQAQPQPETAVQVRTPPGGWDTPSPAPAAAGKRKSVAAAPRLELATPFPAQ